MPHRAQRERTLQTRGLVILAALILLGSILRVGFNNVFLPGWWRIW